jgi:hypothetical protein
MMTFLAHSSNWPDYCYSNKQIFCSEGTSFESWSGYKLSWLKDLMIFLILGECHDSSLNSATPTSFQILTPSGFTISYDPIWGSSISEVVRATLINARGWNRHESEHLELRQCSCSRVVLDLVNARIMNSIPAQGINFCVPLYSRQTPYQEPNRLL